MVLATCQTCGETFEPATSLREKYPGWTPKECRSCYGRGRSRTGTGVGKPADDPATGVFTDGSATPNPGPGGWAAVWVIDDEIQAEVHGHEAATTNNRMELRALIEGVKLVPEGTPAVLWSDSNLAVRTVNEWAEGWERRGWRRKSGPVENLDLVKTLYGLLKARPELEVRWIKAHAGHRWNEYADELASSQD